MGGRWPALSREPVGAPSARHASAPAHEPHLEALQRLRRYQASAVVLLAEPALGAKPIRGPAERVDLPHDRPDAVVRPLHEPDRGAVAELQAARPRYGPSRSTARLRSRASRSLAAYFVAAEALTNVAKYSEASHATVRAWIRDGRATVEVADDGIGGADGSRGSGLRGLRGLADRVEALDGTLRMDSPAGSGTTITAEFPSS